MFQQLGLNLPMSGLPAGMNGGLPGGLTLGGLGGGPAGAGAGNPLAGGQGGDQFSSALGLNNLNFGGIPASDLSAMGVSGSTLQLMGQISMMMASVMTGLAAFLQQLMTSQAQRQAQGGGESAPGGGGEVASASGSSAAASPDSVGQGGNVDQWVDEAVAILESQGVDTSKMNKEDIKTIIEHESGGDPNAQNGWDSNAAKGTPSIGLMQTIQPTFDAHKLDGYDNIRNPVHNIIAAVRYAIDRYGSVSNVPGVVALREGRSYVGY